MKVVSNQDSYSIMITNISKNHTFHIGAYIGLSRIIMQRRNYKGVDAFKLAEIKRNKA
jgi:hypothetical protein